MYKSATPDAEDPSNELTEPTEDPKILFVTGGKYPPRKFLPSIFSSEEKPRARRRRGIFFRGAKQPVCDLPM